MRLFVALPLPEPVRSAMATARDRLAAALPRDAVRWQPLERAHLTLVFLGEVAPERLAFARRAVGLGAAGAGPIELVAAGIGAFPGLARPSVLWLGVDDPEGGLAPLRQRLANACDGLGDAATGGPFRAHLTLARTRRPSAALRRAVAAAAATPPEPVRWRADEVVLYHSLLRPQGAEHRPLERVALHGPA